MLIRVLPLAAALALLPAALRAQCPDGTPPPCATARRTARAVPSPSERARRFLVLPFRNITRAAEQDWLVEGSPVLLADALGRWQDLSVVSDERLYPALRKHGLAPGTVMELAKVRRVAEETNGWTAVTGEVMAIGGRVRVSARAYDVVSNRELVRATAEAQPGEDVRHAYSRIGSRLLGAAGLDSAAANMESATTTSLDAYRAYLRGVSHLRRSEPRRALEALREAVALDSSFAQAYLRLAEASLAIAPDEILNLASPGLRYLARAYALADRLPPRQRDLVRAINDLVHGRFGAARTTLARLVGSDSADVEAIYWLSSLEGFDPILVPVPGGERPRGSINASLRLAKRALEMDPSRHSLYGDLVLYHAMGAGFGMGRARGFRREPPSISAMAMANPDRWFVYLMRDTIELVPVESLRTVPADTLTAGRRRSLTAAAAWARRWRLEAPDEADAYLWSSRIYDMEGSLDSALAFLRRADSLGVETGIENVAVRRISLLRRLGRGPEARRIADSLWTATSLGVISERTRIDAVIEVMRVLVSDGDYVRADSLFSGFVAMLTAQVPRDLAETATLGFLGGGAEATFFGTAPTASLVESLLVAVRRRPPEGRAARWLPPFLAISARGVGADSVGMREPFLAAARDLAARGQVTLAHHLLSGLDSVGHHQALREPWFRARRDAIRALEAATAQRFQPAAAAVFADSVVFTWSVTGGDTATWNRLVSPAMRHEYLWRAAAANWIVTVEYEAAVEPGEQHGTFSRLLAQAARLVIDTTRARGDPGQGIQARISAQSQVRTESSPGTIRITVRHPQLIQALRTHRPAEAYLRFEPCAREGDYPQRCADQAVTVTYP